MKNLIVKIIIYLLSKLNRSNKRDILERIEYLILLANGKHRGFYKLDHEVKMVMKLFELQKVNREKEGRQFIIDVGANLGEYSQKILNSFPNLNYILFEPQEEIFNRCSKKFVNQQNFKIYNFGLFSENIEKNIYQSGNKHGIASVYDRKHEINDDVKYDFKKSNLIELKRFDKLGLKIDNIKLIKIDVEGAELEVLKGFGEYLKKTFLIQFEWGRAQLDSKNSFLEFWELLSKHGFEIYRIHPGGIKKIRKYSWYEEIYIASNFICINKNLSN
jgi:FkbM family methyltransferase